MKKIVSLTLVGIFVACFSCKEEALDKLNPNELPTQIYYATGAEIVTAVNSVYSSWQAIQLMGRMYFYLLDLRSDDVQAGGGQLETPQAQLLNGTHDASNGPMVAVWQGLYRVIHQANLVIENAPKANREVTDALKNRVIGEAKFHRGWAYFELVALWGGVPLMTTYAQTPNAAQPRASAEAVYQLVIQDLTDAAQALPLKSEYGDSDVGRASKGAAQAMLARVYLQNGNYAAAKEQLQALLASNQYQLVDNYLDNFREENEFNAESVWEVAFSSSFGGTNWQQDGSGRHEITFRGQDYGPTAWRNLIPSNSLLAEFETTTKGDAKDDPRYGYSFYQLGEKYDNDSKVIASMQGADPKISWKKYQNIYKRGSEDFQSGINMRVIRLAEVYLMMAECENELGNLSQAITYLNQVRTRKSVEMPPYPTERFPCRDQAEVFEAIVHEKRVEHGGEQVRVHDLLRWRAFGRLKTEPFPYFQTNKHERLPIPQTEIDNNPNINPGDQNPGY